MAGCPFHYFCYGNIKILWCYYLLYYCTWYILVFIAHSRSLATDVGWALTVCLWDNEGHACVLFSSVCFFYFSYLGCSRQCIDVFCGVCVCFQLVRPVTVVPSVPGIPGPSSPRPVQSEAKMVIYAPLIYIYIHMHLICKHILV